MEADHFNLDTLRDFGAVTTSLKDFHQLPLLAPLYGINLLALNPSQRHKAEVKLGKPSCVHIASTMGIEHSMGFNSLTLRFNRICKYFHSIQV